jgi:Amidohydrolase family
VFVLHLYDRAFLNQAAVRAVGYTKATPDPPGGEIQPDRASHPTRLLIVMPKGAIVPGQWADLAVLSADYFAIADEQITRLESLLTLVGGRVVYGAGAFAQFAPPPLPVSPDWSPVATYGGYPRQAAWAVTPARHVHASAKRGRARRAGGRVGGRAVPARWRLTCDCFAF